MIPDRGIGPRGLDRIETLALALTLAGAAAFFALAGSSRAFGVLAGGVFGVANFKILRAFTTMFFTPARAGPAPTTRRKAALIALVLGKFAFFFGGAWLLLAKTTLDPIGVITGFSTLVLAIAASGVLAGALRPANEAAGSPGEAA